MGCRPAEGPLTLVTRREAKQSQRTLGAVTFFSPAGFCGGAQSPVSARHAMKLAQDWASGCTQRAHAPWPSAPWAWSPSASSHPQPARGGPVCGLPGGPPHNSELAGRPSLPRAPNAQSWLLCQHMPGAGARAGVGQGGHGQAGLQDGCGLFANRGPTALGALGFLAGALLLELLPKLPARLHLRGRADGDSSPGLLTSGTGL